MKKPSFLVVKKHFKCYFVAKVKTKHDKIKLEVINHKQK